MKSKKPVKLIKKTKTFKKGGGDNDNYSKPVKGRYGANNVNPADYNNPRRILLKGLAAAQAANQEETNGNIVNNNNRTREHVFSKFAEIALRNKERKLAAAQAANQQETTGNNNRTREHVFSKFAEIAIRNKERKLAAAQAAAAKPAANGSNVASGINKQPFIRSGYVRTAIRRKVKLPEAQALTTNTTTNNAALASNERHPLEARFPFLRTIVSNFKVFVWDFDDTLVSKRDGLASLKRKSINFLQKSQSHLSMDPLLLPLLEANPELAKDFFFEADTFVDLISYLISQDCRVYIASFGYQKNIITILNLLFSNYQIPSPFDETNVKALENDSQRYLWSSKKIPFLQSILGLNSEENILFFDDDYKNLLAQREESRIFGVKLGGDKIGNTNSLNREGFHIGILEKISKYITPILDQAGSLNDHRQQILNIVMKNSYQNIVYGGGKTKKKLTKKRLTQKRLTNKKW